ncbi:hypothetical protein C1H46_033272 [Malus baccata]|uniref:Protein kinase domain-containing protein n=1 Tax=Malus baccata TaxID=106549 RepID=A0A540L4I7_MALBA|nr:hypothetical protein C1H46_033272 [Malus baccata]
MGCNETNRDEDLNWFPRLTALCKFRSWRVPNSSDSSKCMKNIVVPIFGSLLSAVALLLVIVRILIWKLIRIRKAAVDGEKRNKTPVASKKFQFTYDEVLEITENFQTEIGKGGFGIVYHGYLKDGTQIAVKILSPSSSQGAREFQIEV